MHGKMQASPDEIRTQSISKSMITSSSIFWGAYIAWDVIPCYIHVQMSVETGGTT